MPVIDVSNSVVQVGTAQAGPWTTIQDLDTWDATHGTEGGARRRVFGKNAPYVRAGENVDTYDLTGLMRTDDTTGQTVLQTARDNRTTVFLRVMPEGIATGKKGYVQECTVLEYTDSGDASGDYVECSFSLEGVGTKTAATAP